MIADVHIHSTFSADGHSKMEEYCIAAIKQNIPVICFTDHVDFHKAEFNLGKTKDNRKQNFSVDAYFTEIQRLQAKYPTLDILSGIEFSEPHLYYEEFKHYEEFPFDQIIGSIHHCYNSVFPGAGNLNEKKAVYEYYDLMLGTLERCNFQVLAHLDFPRLFFDNWDIQDEILAQIFDLIIKKNIALEINTSSIHNSSDEPLPKYSIIQKYHAHGGRNVTISSDAHIVDRLGYAYDSVRKKLPNGTRVGYFKKREFISTNVV